MSIRPFTAVAVLALAGFAGDFSRASAPPVAPPAGSKAYVSNADSDTVSVVSLPTMSVIATIDVGSEPRAPAATPDGSLVFVPNRFGSDFPQEPTKGGPKGGVSTVRRPSVSVIDTATDTVIDTIPLTQDEPYNCAVTPDGAFLYVVCKGSGAVSVVDVATFLEVATVALNAESSPEGIAITPDGTKVYVVNRGSIDVSVISTATNSVIVDSIPVGSNPRDAKVASDGTKVLVVGEGAPTIILTATDTVSATSFDDIGTQRDVAVDGSIAYVTNFSFDPPSPGKGGPKAAQAGSGSLDVYDLATEQYVDSIEVLADTPYGVDVVVGGDLAYVTAQDSGTLQEINTLTREDTDNFANVQSGPRGVVIVQPRPVVNSFFLPKKVSYRKNAANPSKSKFSAGGFFDTGSRVVDLTAAATLTVGGVDIPVPALTASKNGRTFTYQAGGLKFVVAKNPFGSSRAKFRLSNTGDLGDSVPTDGTLVLRFQNDAVDGQCEVALENGGFRIGKKRGALSKPNLFVVRANGVVKGPGKDAFGLIVGLATSGGTPASPQEVRVEFGTTLKATIPADSFTRKGEKDVFKGDVNGVTSVTVDYLRESVTIFGRNTTLGTFAEGQNPITIFVGVGGDDRGVAVRIARVGKLLRY